MRCEKDSSGESFLEDAPWIQCDRSGFLFSWIVVFFVIYAVGIPILISFVLFWNRRHLHRKTITKTIGFVFEAYKPGFYWWECISFARRFLLLALVSFLEPTSTASVLSILLILIFMFIAQVWLNPFHKPLENWMEITAISSLIVIHVANQLLLSASNISCDLQDKENTSYHEAGLFLVAFNIVVVTIFFVFMLLPTWKSVFRRFIYCTRKVARGSKQRSRVPVQRPTLGDQPWSGFDEMVPFIGHTHSESSFSEDISSSESD